MALVAATMRLRRLVIRARIIVELGLSVIYGSPHAAFRLTASAKATASLAEALRAKAEGGNHADEEVKFEHFFSAKRGFRLSTSAKATVTLRSFSEGGQPEGCGCRPTPRIGGTVVLMPAAPQTKQLIIAIDGPSGAGKGTIARELAARLNYRHVDTGAMYRAVAWKALEAGVDLRDEPAVAGLSERARFELEGGRVVIDGVDVSQAIRTPEIDVAATTVARLPGVRRVLVARQRDIGRGGAVVMEGRDIGTVVFPDAELKIYLDASPEERARRRANDPAHRSSTAAALAEVATALAERDRSDSTRATSPLSMAPDAILIETTGVAIGSVVDRVMAIVDERRHK